MADFIGGLSVGVVIMIWLVLYLERRERRLNYYIDYNENEDVYELRDYDKKHSWQSCVIFKARSKEEVREQYEYIAKRKNGIPEKLRKNKKNNNN